MPYNVTGTTKKARRLTGLFPQPLTGIVAGAAGALVLLAAFAVAAPGDLAGFAHADPAPADLVIAAVLLFALVLAARYPVHVRHNVKFMAMTAPLFLIAVLLAPPFAALTAGVGMLTAALMLRSRLGTRASDVATTVGRWIVVAYASSLVVHSGGADGSGQVTALVLAAGVMFLGDVLSTCLEIAPMSGEPPGRLLRMLVRETALVELVQYLIGLLGALVLARHVWALVLLAIPTGVVYVAFKNIKEMRASTRHLLEDMADAVDLRDPYTGGHSHRVADYCEGILDALRIYGPEAELIVSAARVHDIGKIKVPEAILKKPASLTLSEWKMMQGHVDAGADLLMRYGDFQRGKEIVRHHHERWNGTGYPAGLKGADIPLGARIIAVADSFDAMTSDRPYRQALSAERAAQILLQGRGEQWDPRVVDAFLESIADRLPQVTASAPARAPESGLEPAESNPARRVPAT